MLAKPRTRLEESFLVEVANGQPISIDSVIRNCTLRLNDHDFLIDLIPMKLDNLQRTEIVQFSRGKRTQLATCQYPTRWEYLTNKKKYPNITFSRLGSSTSITHIGFLLLSFPAAVLNILCTFL